MVRASSSDLRIKLNISETEKIVQNMRNIQNINKAMKISINADHLELDFFRKYDFFDMYLCIVGVFVL